MQSFRYVAVAPGGRKVQGVVSASSHESAEAQLVRKQLFPMSLEVTSGTVPSTSAAIAERRLFTKRSKAPKADEISEFLRAICVMVQSGVTVVESLQAIAENAATPAVQELARAMKQEILAGRSLAQSMATHPREFPEVVVDMVSVADESGRLVETLQSVIAYLDRNNAVRKNIIASLTYPGILMSASGIGFLVLIVVILPTFGEAFDSLNVKLPWFTTALMELGKFIRDNVILCLLGVIGSVIGLRRALKLPEIKRAVSLFLLRVPVVGPILTQIALNRSLRTLGSLLKTNVPIIDAITYAAKVAGHIPLTQAWDQVRSMVGNGGAMSESMTATGVFPKMVTQMVAVGERSGRVSELIETITEHSEEHVDRRIKTAVSLVEPMVIIGMGLLVGMITISILMPLFSINNSIK